MFQVPARELSSDQEAQEVIERGERAIGSPRDDFVGGTADPELKEGGPRSNPPFPYARASWRVRDTMSWCN